MRNIQKKFNKRFAFFAFFVLGLIAVITVFSGGLFAVAGIALAIAPVALTDKEQAILDKMKTDLQAEAEKLGKGYIKADEFTATFNQMFTDAMGKFEFKAEKVVALTDAIEATLNKYDLSANQSFLNMQQTVEALKSNPPKGAKPKTMVDAIVAVKDDLKKLITGLKGEVFIDISAAATVKGSVSDNEYSQNLPDIGQLAVRKLPMRSLCRAISMTGDNDNGVIRYSDWDEDTSVRGAAMRAENASFPESTAKWKQYTRELKKIGDTIPVSEEIIEDSASFANELEMFLETNVQIVEDVQLLRGDGTGDNMKGLMPSVSEFAYASYSDTVQDCSEYDLIVKVCESITTTGGNKYFPNFCLAPSSLISKMMLKKDLDNNYVLPPFMIKNGNGQIVVANVAVIEENGFSDANQMVIGDCRYMRLYYKGGITLSRAAVGTQFTSDMLTLKARMRELFLIREADAGGFRKVSDVATAIGSINHE
ncbi:MAG TPA: phage major capsid protein [Flavobacterium sp.]|nr:phage major capsid protein [Flavobacterium sp.]